MQENLYMKKRLRTSEIMHIKEQTCTLLMITCGGRNCTELALKPLAAKTAFLFQSCVLLLSCTLYYFSLHDGYRLFLYTAQSIYIAALPFLVN